MREHKGKSIIALPSEYIVIDTETTGLDYDYCSIIEISALKYRDGNCVESFSTLVKPPLLHYYQTDDDGNWQEYCCYVDDFITGLTGITNEMLETAPEPAAVMPAFLDFIGESVLIGHNAHFDINFLYDAAARVGARPVSNDFIDTLRIARKVFPELAHHRLSDVVEACGITATPSHRAEADAKATAECYERMRQKILEVKTEEDFINSFVYRYKNDLNSLTATTENIDSTNPLYGKVVVFTGALSCMSRKEAFQMVLNLGGIPKDSFNAKTNFLVIGNTDFAKSVKDGKSNKMKKAEALIKKGGDVAVLSEAAFFDMIEDYL